MRKHYTNCTSLSQNRASTCVPKEISERTTLKSRSLLPSLPSFLSMPYLIVARSRAGEGVCPTLVLKLFLTCLSSTARFSLEPYLVKIS